MFNLCGYILITLNLYHQTLINFLKQQYHLIYTNHKLTSSLETGPLAPTEPGPRETQMNLVSREPGRGRCFPGARPWSLFCMHRDRPWRLCRQPII
jgi:hypothetical protein